MRVSFATAAEGGRIRAALAALCAVVALALAAAAAPPSAHASFTIPRCGGTAIEGQGSSAQKEAQLEFWSTTVFHGSEGCGAAAPHVEYAPLGSGCGIASIGGEVSTAECDGFKPEESGPGFRAPGTRFAGSDAPLTVQQQVNADAAGGPHPGVIHQIPVASFAVAVIVHFPNGCQLKDPGSGAADNGVGSLNEDTSTGGPNDPPGAGTGDTAGTESLRVHITAAEMETIWDGTAQTWGNIVPQEQFANGTLTEREECASTPVTRIVRFDGSGTTYNFKAYLSLLPGAPSGLWTESPVAGDNHIWPETFNAEKKQPNPVNSGTNVCEQTSHICTARTNGGGALAEAVTASNGSIGYADLATSRKHNFYMEKSKNDHTYWIPMQTVSPEKGNEVGATYVEPTEVPTSNAVASPEGANCSGADYRGFPAASAEQPDPTLGDWEKAIATGGTAVAIETVPTHAYPVCGLTYDFAFDDDAPVYGESQLEQERARTVKDYLTAVESTQGQFQLALHDYGTLPLSIIEIARKGVEAIGWAKAAGAGKGGEETQTKPPLEKAKESGGGGSTTPPSNSFSITSAKIKHRKIVISLQLPDAGEIKVKAVAHGLTVASKSGHVSGGQGTVTLSVSKAAIGKIAKAKGKKLTVTITVTFTPTGGIAATHTKKLTITAAEVGGKDKGHHRKGKKK